MRQPNPPTRARKSREARKLRRRVRSARQLEVRGDRREIARYLTEHRALLEPLTPGERCLVENGQSVPNAPLRQAAFDWLAREHRRRLAQLGELAGDPARSLVTLNELFAAIGFENSQGRRALGLASEGQRRRDRLAGRCPRIAQTIKRSHALALARAMGLDPAEIGL
jgi:hypothetical protein